ncbi:replication protein A DNA-binding subunit [Zychaea mexicana]|uniref:replication protein A DNA-binding subunit n=1 Tax=Zychaea mexicana TaxID=64656 RepID=UPI0022FDE892|nr:replication protein A DNA-binding subunit [Zychaea mexicana]KAI9498454.1 replication protein A DNA-binding subunit [Zychaea mexicana]
MTVDMQLSTNAIKSLYENRSDPSVPEHPILQVINVKPVQSTTNKRYRVILSDGEFFMQAMLSTNTTSLAENNELERWSLIRLTESVCNEVNGRKILIILGVDIISKHETKIGDPKSIENVGGSPSTSSASNSGTANPGTAQPTPMNTSSSSSSNSNNGPAVQPSGRTNVQLESSLFSITALNPYQNRWTIKARVTLKSDIKHWHNNRSEGKLFNVNLLDKSGEIKATAFNDQVDRLFHVLEEGKVYYISKARVTMARKQFSTLDNEYELVIENQTEIEVCPDEVTIPKMNFSFVRIADIANYEKDATVDIIGVVRDDNGVQEIITKSTGRPVKKRELVVVDDSEKQIRLTLWDKTAENFDSSGAPVVAFRGLRVNDFGGRSLSLSTNGTLKVNPDIPECTKIKHWYASQSSEASYDTFAQQTTNSIGQQSNTRITLGQVKQDGLGTGDRADYFSARATVVFLKNENPAYPSCPDCRKKMVQNENDWHCEKCNKGHPEPMWRYILTASIEDATAQLFVNAFDDVGISIIGVSANEVMRLKDTEPDAYAKLFSDALFKVYNVKGRAKSETFNDTTRTKYTLMEATPINYVQEAKEMVSALEKLTV